MRASLEIKGGGGSVLPLADDKVTIGKAASNDLAIESDPTVSRFHAVVEHFTPGWCIKDVGSRNGTYVNGERVSGERVLRSGDEIRLGATRLVFREDESATDTATAAEEPSQATATLMFTDVEASTEYVLRIGDEPARRAIREQQELVRRTVGGFGGRVVDAAGDGLFVAFDSARSAIKCAAQIQRELEESPVMVRVGLHAGDAIDEGARIFGASVNAAARIAALAKGGEIFVSDTVKQLAGLVEGISFKDRGLHALKGFPDQWKLHELRWKS